ncbi:MAG TPA: hypothetical protein VGI70_18280 [Polyangiales bacterium]|jgi:hypothetical protein
MTAPNAATTVDRRLMCRLTDDEIRERGVEMSREELRIEVLKGERKALNSRIADHIKQRNMLAHTIDIKVELREVPCKWSKDVQEKRWLLRRFDTNEVVETQPLSAADRQLDVEHDLGVEPEPIGKRPKRKHLHPVA